MTPAVYETTSVKIDAGKHRFTVAASKLAFDGFMSVYIQEDDKEETNTLTKGIALLVGLGSMFGAIFGSIWRCSDTGCNHGQKVWG